MFCPRCEGGKLEMSHINGKEYTVFIYCMENKCGFSISLVLDKIEASLIYRKSGTVREIERIPHRL
jgi:hypothetical protein